MMPSLTPVLDVHVEMTTFDALLTACKPCFKAADVGIKRVGAEIVGLYRDLTLSSAFHALHCVHTNRVVAYEGLLRARDAKGCAISPATAFEHPKTDHELCFFDRFVRVVHVLNYAAQVKSRDAKPTQSLYLNVDGRHLVNTAENRMGGVFAGIIETLGLTPSDVVMEILEGDVEGLGQLSEAVKGYQENGYRIAIDDFGSRNSNFDRLWRISPNIVKLDRSLIVMSCEAPKARKVLKKIIETIHELDCVAVVEGIETIEQHQIAVEAGADLLQGFLYGRPAWALSGAPFVAYSA